ncbi:hypothetical protein FKM82_022073 [Ascaphus truei]
MAEVDQQDSQDALNNSSDNNSGCEEACDRSLLEESNSNGVKNESEEAAKEEKTSLKDKSTGNRKASRFHPYGKEKVLGMGEKKSQSRNRVFISNIPYDMKWQAIKDLMREKVGEVTYVELFKDAEGKSRGCGVVEFKDMEFVTKALDVMNKHDLSGRPLNIKADADGEHARRALQRGGAPFSGGHNSDMGPGIMNIPPSIMNNPNIPPDIISALRAGRLGTTVFVANLDFKVGWKKLKEVFSIAGTVKRADIKEDKDGKSRGMGTVTFEQAIESVQAISMFNGQFLFDRPMHVKMDDKSIPQDDFHAMECKTPQLPRGLGGIGMGLGPGGQPIGTTQRGMGNMGPGGMGVDGPGFGGMNRMGASGFGGMEGINNMTGFSGVSRMTGMGGVDDFRGSLGSGMGNNMGSMASSMGDMYRGGVGGGMDRDFGRSDIGLNRGFGDSFGGMSSMFGGMGGSSMGPLGSGMSSGMSAVNSMAMSLGMDRMNTSYDRLGSGLDRSIDMDRGFGGFGSAQLGSGMRDRGNSKGCQIFARNLPFDLTWQKLKEKFNQCGRVMFAEIKMENGKSKGCGTVRFDCPETAEKACRLMNGIKINGREIDVRLDRNA